MCPQGFIYLFHIFHWPLGGQAKIWDPKKVFGRDFKWSNSNWTSWTLESRDLCGHQETQRDYKDPEEIVYSWSTLMIWSNYGRHKRWIFVGKTGEFLWTLLVNSHGHFFGEFSWTFLVNFRGHFFNSNEKSYTLIKQ